MSKLTTIYDKHELAEKLEELINLISVKHERKDKDHHKVSALEMIRCGIGGNYGGDYYDEVIKLIHEPIVNFIADLELDT